ncbi:MAG: hypothetical protein V1662_03205 [Candidatus Omnitrophota bacterium]
MKRKAKLKEISSGAGPLISFAGKRKIAVSPGNLLNSVLLVILIVLGVFFIGDLLIITPGWMKAKVGALQETQEAFLKIPGGGALSSGTVLPSYYTQPVQSKDLFTVTPAESAYTSALPSLAEVTSKLKLQGVISQPNPQAIIENVQTKETFFISPGERIGEIELKEILPSGVKIIYQGLELELSL